MENAAPRTLLTVPEIAERWNCSAGLVRKLEKRGKIAGVRIGALLRIPLQEVEKFECQSKDIQSSDSGAVGQ
jgi:excisionase family DNA binding protein